MQEANICQHHWHLCMSRHGHCVGYARVTHHGLYLQRVCMVYDHIQWRSQVGAQGPRAPPFKFFRSNILATVIEPTANLTSVSTGDTLMQNPHYAPDINIMFLVQGNPIFRMPAEYRLCSNCGVQYINSGHLESSQPFIMYCMFGL